MKKFLILMLFVVCLFAVAIFGCDNSSATNIVFTVGENGNVYANGVDSNIEAKDNESDYQLYLDNHPEYNKSEDEWRKEFILGNENIQGLNFYLQDNGCYYVDIGKAIYLTKIVIPDYYNGRKVAGILSTFSTTNANVEELILSENIDYIGVGAFDNCKNLKLNLYQNGYYLGTDKNNYFALIKTYKKDIVSLEVNSDCKIIVDGVFTSLSKLENISLNDLVVKIKSNMFADCVSLTSIELNNSVVEIENNAFSNCTSLKVVVFSDNLTKIGDYAFCNCSAIATITIGKNMLSIGEKAFYNCNKLKTVINYSEISIDNSTDNGYIGYYSDKIINMKTLNGIANYYEDSLVELNIQKVSNEYPHDIIIYSNNESSSLIKDYSFSNVLASNIEFFLFVKCTIINDQKESVDIYKLYAVETNCDFAIDSICIRDESEELIFNKYSLNNRIYIYSELN